MTSEQLLHTAILIPSLEPDERLPRYVDSLRAAGLENAVGVLMAVNVAGCGGVAVSGECLNVAKTPIPTAIP